MRLINYLVTISNFDFHIKLNNVRKLKQNNRNNVVMPSIIWSTGISLLLTSGRLMPVDQMILGMTTLFGLLA